DIRTDAMTAKWRVPTNGPDSVGLAERDMQATASISHAGVLTLDVQSAYPGGSVRLSEKIQVQGGEGVITGVVAPNLAPGWELRLVSGCGLRTEHGGNLPTGEYVGLELVMTEDAEPGSGGSLEGAAVEVAPVD